MSYWLLKSDPDTYAWEDLVKEGETDWTGVRNFQARNNLAAMKVGDRAFFYHSQEERAIVGVVEVTEAAKPDPTAQGELGSDKRGGELSSPWVSVRIRPLVPCGRVLSLEEIRHTHGLASMALVTHARLSVQPVKEFEWNAILAYTKTTLS